MSTSTRPRLAAGEAKEGWRDLPRFLDGRAALVTGGSRGIGAGVALRLAGHGASVVVTYSRSAEHAEHLVRLIQGNGGTAHAILADATVAEDVQASVSRAHALLGGLDVLVNNAGGGSLSRLDEVDPDEIEWIISVNVKAAVLAAREALRYLPPGGRIINIGSVNADRTPIPGGSVYAASKGAIASFTRGLARELGPRRITVNNVQPGPVDTDMNPADGPDAHLMLKNMVFDRFGTTDEVGALVAFLAGPDADFITGSSITIDGGFGA